MMKGLPQLLKTVVLATMMQGCAAGAGIGSARSIANAERMQTSLKSNDVHTMAKDTVRGANEALALAKSAEASGDSLSAELHAERALALYTQAVAIARRGRATNEEEAAKGALAIASEEARRYEAERKAIDLETEELEKKLRIAREAQLPQPSGPAEPDRQRARIIAAQSLLTEARLLCGAARLVSGEAPGLREAESTVSTLEKQRATIAIDPTARARAACLASLTRARRTTIADANAADTLLTELSQSYEPKGKSSDLAPKRDERGVVITMRALFQGEALTPEGQAALRELARVASAHPTFAVQVVLHDGLAPNANESRANQKRGEAIARLLAEAGAKEERIKVELAGAGAPLIDPKDARGRERNARVELVFVASGN